MYIHVYTNIIVKVDFCAVITATSPLTSRYKRTHGSFQYGKPTISTTHLAFRLLSTAMEFWNSRFYHYDPMQPHFTVHVCMHRYLVVHVELYLCNCRPLLLSVMMALISPPLQPRRQGRPGAARAEQLSRMAQVRMLQNIHIPPHWPR